MVHPFFNACMANFLHVADNTMGTVARVEVITKLKEVVDGGLLGGSLKSEVVVVAVHG